MRWLNLNTIIEMLNRLISPESVSDELLTYCFSNLYDRFLMAHKVSRRLAILTADCGISTKSY